MPATRFASNASPRARSAPPRERARADRRPRAAARWPRGDRTPRAPRGCARASWSRARSASSRAPRRSTSPLRASDARLPLDVLRAAVGLGRSRELAERLELRRRLGELRRAATPSPEPPPRSRGPRARAPFARAAASSGLPARSKSRAARARSLRSSALRASASARDRPPKILSRRWAKPTNLPCPPSPPARTVGSIIARTRSLAAGPPAVKLSPHGEQQPAGRAPRPREAHLAHAAPAGAGRAAEDRATTSATRSPSSASSPTTRSPTSSRQQYRVPTINLDEYEIDADDPEARPEGAVREAPGHPRLAHGQLAHRRDGRPDEPQRDRRPQVPHRLQHRAGRRVARRRSTTAIERYYNAGPSYDEVHGGLRRGRDRVRRRRRRRQPPRAREGQRGRAGRPARAT